MRSHDLTTLVHLLGFLTGIALYAMLGTMIVRTRQPALPRSTGSSAAHADNIPLATAVLGLLWNAGALLTYGLRDFGLGEPSPWAVAASFAALGFLPAVVVHAASQGVPQRRETGWLVRIAYALSASAGLVQFEAAAVSAHAPSRPALLMLTAGYLLVIAALAVLMRKQPGWRRGVSVVALALFAITALHMSQHGAGTDAWWIELAGHHASIPLALAILYQDYRFALADLFLKRVVTLLALVAAVLLLYLGVLVPVALPRLRSDVLDPRGTGVLVALWIATAAAYPLLRRAVNRFVERVVLRRVDYRRLCADLGDAIASLEPEAAVLDAVCHALAPALWAQQVRWTSVDVDPTTPIPPQVAVQLREGRQDAIVHVATAAAPSYLIEVARLAGGRLLLSDDLRMLEDVAHLVAHRIDALRFTRERVARTLREQEILQLATEAELRALRAQLNPHFLFNTLTTIGYLMREAPDRALETLYRLTGLLRAVLKRSDGEFATLAQELEIVRSYLAIESARFEERLTTTIDVPDELADHRIPPLLLQPLVENAIKHGIGPRAAGGHVIVTARLEPTGQRDAQSAPTAGLLCLSVIDTGVGAAPADFARRRKSGIGLSNVERRLDRYYGGAASLTVRSAADVGTTVEIRLPTAPSHALAAVS